MRVEISSSTAVGPDWRRLIGTLRSDWSTEAWLGCWETVASCDIAAAPSLVDRQAHAADGLLTSRSMQHPASQNAGSSGVVEGGSPVAVARTSLDSHRLPVALSRGSDATPVPRRVPRVPQY